MLAAKKNNEACTKRRINEKNKVSRFTTTNDKLVSSPGISVRCLHEGMTNSKSSQGQ